MRKKIATVILFSTLLLVWACEPYEEILSDLSQKETNLALVTLRKKNITARKTSQKSRNKTLYSVSVKQDQVAEALKVIVSSQIPQEKSQGLPQVYSKDNVGMIPTKSDEKARFLMATQGEIESLIKFLPRVIEAKLVISGFMEESPKLKKASVIALVKGKKSIDVLSQEIREIVAFSLSEISLENINVIVKSEKKEAIPLQLQQSEKFSTKNFVTAFFALISILSLVFSALLLRKYVYKNKFVFWKFKI